MFHALLFVVALFWLCECVQLHGVLMMSCWLQPLLLWCGFDACECACSHCCLVALFGVAAPWIVSYLLLTYFPPSLSACFAVLFTPVYTTWLFTILYPSHSPLLLPYLRCLLPHFAPPAWLSPFWLLHLPPTHPTVMATKYADILKKATGGLMSACGYSGTRIFGCSF